MLPLNISDEIYFRKIYKACGGNLLGYLLLWPFPSHSEAFAALTRVRASFIA